MKIIVEREDGIREELKEAAEIRTVTGSVRALVAQVDYLLRDVDRKKIEREIEAKTGIPTVVIDGKIKALYAIPQ